MFVYELFVQLHVVFVYIYTNTNRECSFILGMFVYVFVYPVFVYLIIDLVRVRMVVNEHEQPLFTNMFTNEIRTSHTGHVCFAPLGRQRGSF